MPLFAIVVDLEEGPIPSDEESNIRFLSYHPCTRDKTLNGHVDILTTHLTEGVDCQVLCHRDDAITSNDLVIVFLNCPVNGSPEFEHGVARMQAAMNGLFDEFMLKHVASGVKRNGTYTDNSASVIVMDVAECLQEQMAEARRLKFKVVSNG